MDYKYELAARYKETYNILCAVHIGGTSSFIDVLQDSRHELESRAALDFIIEKKWIGNIDNLYEALSGDYGITFNKDPYVSTDGLRYINFYEKYHDKGLDIVSMTLGDSQLVEYYAKKDKNSTLKTIIIIIITAISTALATKYFS